MCRWFYWNLKWLPQVSFLIIHDRKNSNLINGGDDTCIGFQASCNYWNVEAGFFQCQLFKRFVYFFFYFQNINLHGTF